MRNKILVLLLIFCNLRAYAESTEDRYGSFVTEKGTIHFFRPKTLKRTKNMHWFEYDMTYADKTDSVTINYTICIDGIAKVDKFFVSNGDNTVEDDSPICLYRDVQTSTYEVRTSSRLSFEEITRMYESKAPLIFTVILSNGCKCTATYQRAKWAKESFIITQIIKSIKM